MLRKLFDSLSQNYSEQRFRRETEEFNRLEKSVCHSDFDRSTAWLVEQLREAGFSSVERIELVADGVTSACDAIMPEAWDLTARSYLDVVSEWPENERRIADTAETMLAAATWCGATPPAGSTGELVAYDPEHPENACGKWVLCDGLPVSNINQPLARAGALGIVATDLRQGNRNPDATRWMNGPGTWGWYYLKGEPRLPIFMVSSRRALALKACLDRSEKVILHGVMNTRHYDGKIYTVTALLPGESKEEFGLFAHMYEPFLSDDASGVAACIEIGRMVKASGIRLRKSLRVLFSMEHYGFAEYLVQRPHRLKAAINLDTLATPMYRELGYPMHWRLSPLCLPFFGDLLLEELLREVMPDLRWSPGPGTLSDDTFGGDPMLGVPTNWMYTEVGEHHHTSDPIFSDVDWEMAGTVIRLVAAYTAFLLTAEAGDFKSLLPNLAALAVKPLGNSSDTPFVRKVKCDFAAAELASLERWEPGIIDAQAPEDAVAPFRLPGAEIIPGTDLEREAAELIVTRLEPGTPWSLARVPYPEKRYFDDFRIVPLQYALCDGRRTLLETVRMCEAVIPKRWGDRKLAALLDTVRYLESYGYLRLVKVEN
jgi:hypothetical protein